MTFKPVALSLSHIFSIPKQPKQIFFFSNVINIYIWITFYSHTHTVNTLLFIKYIFFFIFLTFKYIYKKQGFAIYEPIGIVAGVALGELPQLWKMLHEHGDQVDKELDAVIMVQSVWRAKKQSKR